MANEPTLSLTIAAEDEVMTAQQLHRWRKDNGYAPPAQQLDDEGFVNRPCLVDGKLIAYKYRPPPSHGESVREARTRSVQNHRRKTRAVAQERLQQCARQKERTQQELQELAADWQTEDVEPELDIFEGTIKEARDEALLQAA